MNTVPSGELGYTRPEWFPTFLSVAIIKIVVTAVAAAHVRLLT